MGKGKNSGIDNEVRRAAKDRMNEIDIRIEKASRDHARAKFYLGVSIVLSALTLLLAIGDVAIGSGDGGILFLLFGFCCIPLLICIVKYFKLKAELENALDEKAGLEQELGIKKNSPSPQKELHGHYELIRIEGGEAGKYKDSDFNLKLDIKKNNVGFEDYGNCKVRLSIDPETKTIRVEKQTLIVPAGSGSNNIEVGESVYKYTYNNGILTIFRKKGVITIYKKKSTAHQSKSKNDNSPSGEFVKGFVIPSVAVTLIDIIDSD